MIYYKDNNFVQKEENMGYYEFKIMVSEESKDALTQRASEIGALGFVENADNIVVYFPDVLGIENIKKQLNGFKDILKKSGLNGNLSYDYVFISERDWNESWKKKFKPIKVGDAITILPPWENKKEGSPKNHKIFGGNGERRINLIIDPGMAFGTGHHETTKTCLMLIEKFAKKLPQKEHFLDFGTGTGILAIAALKLGFKRAVCLDIDPLAIDAAKRNAELNGIENIDIVEGSIDRAKEIFDFIAANLMSDILIQNAAKISQHLKPDGIAMLSGIIDGQDFDVIKAMQDNGLHTLDTIKDGRWVTVIVTH